MNNLINQLKLQSGINDNPDQEGLDLFAELIVKECARLADQTITTGHGHGNLIRTHFGFELQTKVF